jgi:site-specific recombinase XerC
MLIAFAHWYEHTRGDPFSPPQILLSDAEAWLQSEAQRGLKSNSLNSRVAALRLLGEWLVMTGQTDSHRLRDLPTVIIDDVQASTWLDFEEIVRLYRGPDIF